MWFTPWLGFCRGCCQAQPTRPTSGAKGSCTELPSLLYALEMRSPSRGPVLWKKPSGEEVVTTGGVSHLHSYPWAPMCPHGLELRGSAMAGEHGPCSPGCCFSHWHPAQALGHHTLPQQPGLDPEDLPRGQRICALAHSLCVFLARPSHLFLCQHHPRV